MEKTLVHFVLVNHQADCFLVFLLPLWEGAKSVNHILFFLAKFPAFVFPYQFWPPYTPFQRHSTYFLGLFIGYLPPPYLHVGLISIFVSFTACVASLFSKFSVTWCCLIPSFCPFHLQSRLADNHFLLWIHFLTGLGNSCNFNITRGICVATFNFIYVFWLLISFYSHYVLYSCSTFYTFPYFTWPDQHLRIPPLVMYFWYILEFCDGSVLLQSLGFYHVVFYHMLGYFCRT